MASQWGGFALWNTSTHNFSTAHTAARRDVFGEYVAASRALGMRSGRFSRRPTGP
jgi:alpha-L-fucosidase